MAGTYSRETDVAVIGGGPGGYVAAIRLGQLGRRVLLIERDELGGECLNRGCIPSKALIHASLLYRALRVEGPTIGVLADGARFDMAKAQTWKQGVVAKERQGVSTLLRAAGVGVLKGEARFTGPRSLEFAAPDGGHERIDFKHAVIAAGARHVSLPGFEPDGTRVVNAENLLNWSRLPNSVLVLGGGVSGCELGEFLSNVGVSVTIVELMPQILPGLEPELARELSGALERSGITLRTGTRAVGLQRTDSGVQLTVEHDGKQEGLSADTLFLTIGKKPDTAGLGLEEAGVQTEERGGWIRVDDRQETSAAGI
ncbi:MAG TPA: FAD-dependent oxidoreductase, partial [Thermoplasmata archaeon]|nr:FAD-dependent oxidoreductase [Thermoplasmata archaeon]